MEFFRPEYWSGLPFPSPRDLPNQGIEPRCPTLQANSLPSWATREAQDYCSGWPIPSSESSQPRKSNPGLLHSRRILYQLSYEGSPWRVVLLLLLSRFSRVWLLATPWTAAYQAPPSMGFSRQEYWSGLPFPSPLELCCWALNIHKDPGG